MHPRRHQIIARAFRRAAGQHGRFDFDEAVLVEVVAHQLGDAVAQAQVLLHRLAAQVQVAVLQADVLVEVVVVDLERGRQAGVEDFQGLGQHLDHAGGQVGVLGAGGPGAHLADHAQDEFAAHVSSATLKASGVSGSITTCTVPSRSRRSMKMTPPWSRRRWAQPHRLTICPCGRR
jgi:hypothetical protein